MRTGKGQNIGMKRKLLGIGCCILLYLFLLFGVSGTLSPLSSSVFALADGEDAGKYVFLTFDDGPSDSTTPRVLDILKDEGVPATFFVIGRQAERRDYLLKRILQEGHTLGIHTYSHEYDKIYASTDALLEDIKKCSDVLEKTVSVKTNLYRFPGGSFSVRPQYLKAVRAAGYRYVDWNACTRDGDPIHATPERLYREAIKTTGEKRYVILLMHDQAHRDATVASLRDIIRFYKEKNYRFGSL